MKRIIPMGCAAAWALAALSAQAASHVTLTPSEGAAGSRPTLAFQINGGCPVGMPTRSVDIALPFRLRLTQAMPQSGWALQVQDSVDKNGPLGRAGSVRWTRAGTDSVDTDKIRFSLDVRLPYGETRHIFSLRQDCADGRSIDSRVLFHTLAPGPAPVEVSNAWMRTPPDTGPRDTAAFMALKASQSVRLVQAFSSAAGRIDIEHTLQSKIRGLQMFPAADIKLPAGSTVRLMPGLIHLAVHGLDDSLGEGAEVPVTLRFEDAAGIITERVVAMRLSSRPPSEVLPRTDRK